MAPMTASASTATGSSAAVAGGAVRRAGRRRKRAAPKQVDEPLQCPRVEQSAVPGDPRLHDHPEGNRFAVQQWAVSSDGLEGMADRVPEVEGAAQVALVGIALDERRLDGGRALHEALE